MKINCTNKLAKLCLILGLALTAAPSAKAQAYTNTGALFSYAVFYNGLLEFSDCATMTIDGRVHCNSNIYLGTPSISTLTFNQPVTASRTITNPPNVGISQAQWTGTNVFNGTPAPGWATGIPALTLPIVSNAYREIIQLPAPGEDASAATNPLSQQRYYYKAGLVILVTNLNTSNVVTSVIMKSSMFDPSPLVVSYTNNLPTNTGALYTNYLRMTTNWNWYGCGTWLTTNATFFDGRQNQTNHVTQIDVGKFGSWIATNTNALAKWNYMTPFNGVVYVADYRTTNSMFMDCVRLTNGQTIPAIGASNHTPYTIPGLSVATVNPLYIVGLYNCPGTNNVSSTNTVGTRPCSVICDALTILSPAWGDGNSWTEASGGPVPTAATSDTVNTAVIAGNVPSTGTSISTFSGGVQNLPRLLENWAGDMLWLNTSLVCLYPSAQATHQFEQPAAYYLAPTRRFSFDQNFNTFAGLPPGTPLLAPPTTNASIVLSDLAQFYDGTPRRVTATTDPAGLDVTLTYQGSTNAPVVPGYYSVKATVSSPGYVGVTTNLLIVSPTPITFTVSNLTQTYDGTVKSPAITSSPPGASFYVTYNGWYAAPTNAGTYTVVAFAYPTLYTGATTNQFIINQAAATVSQDNLSQTFDGAAKGILVTTLPPGLATTTTYDGSPNAPTNAGSYVVVTAINDPNYQGGATNTLVIAPSAIAPVPIVLSGTILQTDGTFQLSFTNTPGVSFTVLGSTDPMVALTNWTVLGSATEVAPGQFQFIDMQATNSSQQFYMIRSP